MTNSTTNTPILDDDAVAEIAAWKTNSYGSMVNLPVAKRDALCATVRALREQLATANKQRDDALVRAAEDQDYDSEQRAALQFQLEQVRKERDLMRSACIEKVKAMRDEWTEEAEGMTSYEPAIDYSKRDAANEIITALESVSIQEQKSFPCGAPRPDDGSECLYGVCPRPRDGCSMYCWQHHRSQCVVQQQEAKQS